MDKGTIHTDMFLLKAESTGKQKALSLSGAPKQEAGSGLHTILIARARPLELCAHKGGGGGQNNP